MKSWWNEIKTLQETQLAMENLNRDQSRKNLNYSKHTNKRKPSLSLNAFIRKAFHVLAVKIISHAINYSSSTCQGKFCSNCVCPPLRYTQCTEKRPKRSWQALRTQECQWLTELSHVKGVSSFLNRLQNTTQVCLPMPSAGLFRRLFSIEIFFPKLSATARSGQLSNSFLSSFKLSWVFS